MSPQEWRRVLGEGGSRCHQGSKVQGGLRLENRSAALAGGENDGPAGTPHQPAGSSLLRRITSTDPEEVMPAKGDPLPAREIALLRRWIEEGATWPDLDVASFELTPLAADLAGTVRSRAEAAGFALGSVDPEGDRLRVSIAAARPGALFRWLAELEAAGVLVEAASVTPNADQTVAVQLTLSGRA